MEKTLELPLHSVLLSRNRSCYSGDTQLWKPVVRTDILGLKGITRNNGEAFITHACNTASSKPVLSC